MFFSDIPECGHLYVRPNGLIKEGDAVQLFFVPKGVGDFQWLHNSTNIHINDETFAQSHYTNNEYVLTIKNIQLKQAGLYRVRCSSRITTQNVNIIITGKCDSTFSIYTQ